MVYTFDECIQGAHGWRVMKHYKDFANDPEF